MTSFNEGFSEAWVDGEQHNNPGLAAKPAGPGGLCVVAVNPYKDVAEMCIQLAGFDVYYHDAIENKLVNRAGFTDFESYDYDTISTFDGIDNTAPHAFAHKKMPDGTTVVMVAIRGTGTEHGLFESADTWISNINTGLRITTEHWGFGLATNNVVGHLNNYLWRKNLTVPGSTSTLKSNVKIVITGHSRGAAVGNLLTERLHTKYAPKDEFEKVQERIFNYNFATPWTVADKPDAKERANILNINNKQDPITTNLPTIGKWYRHGKDITFDKAGDPNTGLLIGSLGICLGHHRAELYQREIIRNTGLTPSLG